MNLSQKQIAVRFLELTAAGEVDEAYSNYTAPNFKHHNPYYAGDATSLKEGMRESAIETPNKVFDVNMSLKRAIWLLCIQNLKCK